MQEEIERCARRVVGWSSTQNVERPSGRNRRALYRDDEGTVMPDESNLARKIASFVHESVLAAFAVLFECAFWVLARLKMLLGQWEFARTVLVETEETVAYLAIDLLDLDASERREHTREAMPRIALREARGRAVVRRAARSPRRARRSSAARLAAAGADGPSSSDPPPRATPRPEVRP